MTRKVPKDTGWSWVVMLGAWICMFFVVGTFKSLGLLFVEFLAKFEASSATTAWMMGAAACCMSLLSPAANYVASRYSSRLTVTLGTISCALAFFVTSFATNIYTVVVCFGLFSGIGYAGLYGPSLMILGVYFNKRRSLANGLAMAGASVGQLVIPQMMSYLIDTYSLEGALIIYSAFHLHCFLAAMFLRPPSFYESESQADKNSKVPPSITVDTELDFKPSTEPLISNTKLVSQNECNKTKPVSQNESSKTKPVSKNEISKTKPLSQNENNTGNTPRCTSLNGVTNDSDVEIELCPNSPVPGNEHMTKPPTSALDGIREIDENMSSIVPELVSKSSSDSLSENKQLSEGEKYNDNKTKTTLNGITRVNIKTADVESIPENEINIVNKPFSPNLNGITKVNVDPSDVTSQSDEPALKDLLKPCAKSLNPSPRGSVDDIRKCDDLLEYKNGALDHVKKLDDHYTSKESLYVIESQTATKQIVNEEIKLKAALSHNSELNKNIRFCGVTNCCSFICGFYQWHHLTNALFIIYVFCEAVGVTNYINHLIFIPSRAMEIGIDQSDAAGLLSIIGIGDLIGRIAGGFIADLPMIRRSYLMGGSLIVTGVVSIATTTVPSYVSMVILSIVLGVFGGIFVCLIAVVLIDFLGLAKFPSAFGLVVMFQGLLNTGWPSLLGWLADRTGSYASSYYVAGSLLVLSGSALFLEDCARRIEDRKNKGFEIGN